jgi:cytochrome c-type biogenesis protein
MGIAVQEIAPRRGVLGHALMFIAGFTLVFVVFGATAGLLLGSILRTGFESALIAIGGVLLIILGFHMAGMLKWLVGRLDKVPSIQKPLAWIDRKLDELILPERRKQAGYGQAPGFIRSGVVGMAFAAGWTPCVGPLLGAIMGLAWNASRATSPVVAVLQSAALLFAYSMGLAIPFLITAWILNIASGLLRRINRYLNIVEIISAILLIGIGLLLVFGTLSTLNQYFSFLGDQPEWIYQLEYALSNYGVSLPIAILAGLLSFLSPCVLPLIPVYLGYLTGVASVSDAEAT